jgi:hypothetical protein
MDTVCSQRRCISMMSFYYCHKYPLHVLIESNAALDMCFTRVTLRLNAAKQAVGMHLQHVRQSSNMKSETGVEFLEELNLTRFSF